MQRNVAAKHHLPIPQRRPASSPAVGRPSPTPLPLIGRGPPAGYQQAENFGTYIVPGSYQRPATAAGRRQPAVPAVDMSRPLPTQQISLSFLQDRSKRPAASPSSKSRGYQPARAPSASRHRSTDPMGFGPGRPQSAWSALELSAGRGPLLPHQPDGPILRVGEPHVLEAPPGWGAPARRPMLPPRAAAAAGTAAELVGGPSRPASRSGNTLQDFGVLASACYRAGRRHEEAIAVYCSGGKAQHESNPPTPHAPRDCAPPPSRGLQPRSPPAALATG